MELSISGHPFGNRPAHTEPVGVIAWFFRREACDRSDDREPLAWPRTAASEVVLGQLPNHPGLAQDEREGVDDGALSASVRADDSRLLVEDEFAFVNAAESRDSQFGNSHRFVI